MATQYTRSQLRDVLVEFYTRVDPSRLEAGIDINGMIDWIIYHGPDDMNARLQAKYGTSLDFDILNEPKEKNQSALHRISMMPNTQLIEQQSKRLELRAKVQAFYKENDPDKLATVDTFVEWIEVNGEKAFNDLLMKKYGKTMGVVTRAKPTPPTPPPTVSAASNASANTTAVKSPPNLPPRQNSAPPMPDAGLVEKLKRFYALHEPDQPNDPEPIAEWAASVGMDVLNEKLMQLYGGNLETLSDDESRSFEAPPPPDDDDYPAYREASSQYNIPPPPEEEEVQPELEPIPEPEPEPEPEPQVEPPEPPKPPVITMNAPPKPPPAPVLEPPKPRFAEPPKKPEPPKIVTSPQPKVSAPPKAPEVPRFVAKPQALPRIPTIKNQPPMKPIAPAASKPRTIHAAVAAQSMKPPPPGSKSRKRRPSEGACDSYMLDLSGDGFGVCVCGFNRAAHMQPKVAGTDRRSLKVKPSIGKQDNACKAYRVDVSGKKFGDCVCGWGKTEHGKANPLHPNTTIPSSIPKTNTVMPVASVAADSKPDDVVDWMFDQATTTVFNIMVESFVEQHGEQPDTETKIDWASNLVKLSLGKDATNGKKLKVRAKAIPKKKN